MVDVLIDDRYNAPDSQCLKCVHLHADGIGCDAFDEIPIEVWANEISHKKPIAGDNGIQFKAKYEQE